MSCIQKINVNGEKEVGYINGCIFIHCSLFQLFHRHGDGWMYNNHMKHSVKPSEEQASSASTQPTEGQ